jgi:pyrroloquinoline quinone biosynthesis protein D
VAAIADVLAKEYSAPLDHILADTISMLQELTDKGVVSA